MTVQIERIERRRFSVRMTEAEALELAVLRHAFERAERRPVTLRAALRAAIDFGYASDWSAMDYGRAGGELSARIEMILPEDAAQRLDEIRASQGEGVTQTAAILACARHYLASKKKAE